MEEFRMFAAALADASRAMLTEAARQTPGRLVPYVYT